MSANPDLNISKETLVALIERGFDQKTMAKELKVSYSYIKKKIKQYCLKLAKRKHSEEWKRNMSEKRKKWLADNPDKHPWRQKNRFKSAPCIKLKEWLASKNINFIEEYQPRINDRFFSIDIAFPDKKIGIEVNGGQHYDTSGKLRPYYQNRHDLIERDGWKLYELHYSLCYDTELIEKILPDILKSEIKLDFDYLNYAKPKGVREMSREEFKEKYWDNCNCGGKKDPKAKKCQKCYDKERGIIPVSKEYLEKAILEKPMTQIAKDLNMSDNGVKRWCKRLGVIIPKMRGYWIRRKAGLSHEEALKPAMKKVCGPNLRLSDVKVTEIKEDLNKGMKIRDVVIKHGIEKIQAIDIKYNRRYKKVLEKLLPHYPKIE